MIDATHELPIMPPGPTAGDVALDGVLPAAADLGRRSGADAAHRRAAPELPLRRQPHAARHAAARRLRRRPPACRDADARRWASRRCTRQRNTSAPHPEHQIYPYLLQGLTIDRPNQVWATDITYIPMRRGFVYLVAIVDWATRRVLAHRVSISMSTDFCVEALEEAITRYGRPEIFNTDQGSQFTSTDFTDVLQGQRHPHQHGRQGPLASTTSSSSGCGRASSTSMSISTPTRTSPRRGSSWRPTSTSTTPSARIRR